MPAALGEILGQQRGSPAEVTPLRPQMASRVFAPEGVHADDLVAIGAAALAAEVS